jgi:hypothetical protein
MKPKPHTPPGITEKMKGDFLLADLLRQYRRAAQVEIAELVFSHLNHKPIVANTLIQNNTLTHNENGLTIAPTPAKPKRGALTRVRLYKGRLTSGRARRIAAMKAYWKKRRAQKAQK